MWVRTSSHPPMLENIITRGLILESNQLPTQLIQFYSICTLVTIEAPEATLHLHINTQKYTKYHTNRLALYPVRTKRSACVCRNIQRLLVPSILAPGRSYSDKTHTHKQMHACRQNDANAGIGTQCSVSLHCCYARRGADGRLLLRLARL